MTDNEIQTISKDEYAFRVEVLSGLAGIRSAIKADRKDLRDLECTVFGSQQGEKESGLIGRVVAVEAEQIRIKNETSRTNKLLAVLNSLLALAAAAWAIFSGAK